MQMPKKVKYRKVHLGKLSGKSSSGTKIVFGDFGLQSLEKAWITARQIEAGRIAINRFVKRGGKVWIRIFPHRSVTKKPAETRMGSGKGSPDYWVAKVLPGRVLFELGGIKEEVAREAMRLAAHKLPVKTRFLTRGEM
ncbi:MAG: 50S ribosomal protein L16 [Armatimonadetes bacterium CG07_land_8_20_14_0_80_40_9]|nr:MAG: 50S ribosomal protein L16 [Armatimonadetes bacterium CG07_land_8_20_14_0_80_40_9]